MGDCSAWEGEPVEYDLSRCLRVCEYSDEELTPQYQALSQKDIETLMTLPCLFAYEDHCSKDAKLGKIIRIRKKDGRVRIDYEILKNSPSLSPKEISKLSWDLGIGNWEMNRTHWALKREDLGEVLRQSGLPGTSLISTKALIDITQHMFDIALSFPGEQRAYVESVANQLSVVIPPTTLFYDNYYKAQLARPNLDNLLQDIYRNRSKLIVIFLCTAYAEKQWCGIEFRAIKEIIMSKKDDMIMFVRHDKGEVPGVFSSDGYIDAATHSPKEVADLILERAKLISNK